MFVDYRVEKDAQMLANRIELLKKEQQRTKKKTEDTNKMSENMMSKKLALENKLIDKDNTKDKQMQDLAECQREFQDLYVKRRDDMRRIKSGIESEKYAEARMIKEQSMKNDKRKQEIETEFTQKNRAKKTMVNIHQEKGAKKVKDFKEKKLQNFKSNYNSRVQAEYDKIKQKEDKLAEMERLEKELIDHLQNSQESQKKAFKNLESAMKYQSSKRAFMTSKSASPTKTCYSSKKTEGTVELTP